MKKVLLFLSLLLLTGCSTEYNIELKEGSFSEEIVITVPKSVDDSRMNDLIENSVYPKIDNEVAIYNKEIVEEGNNKKVVLSYTYSDVDFSESVIMQQCFDNFSYIKRDDYYLINVVGNFYCLEQNEKVSIKISTDGDVINSNANKKSGRTYIWEIDKKNVNNVNISFQVSRPIKDINGNMGLVLKVIILGGIVFLVAYIFYRIMKIFS